MSLILWFPLIGSNVNKGFLNVSPSDLGTVKYESGKFGTAFRSGGTTQVTNGISFDNNLVDIFNSKGTASVSVWVKPLGTHFHYNGTILSSGNWNAKRWAFGVKQDNSAVDVLCGNYNTYITCSVPVNEWTHLVSTYNNRVCLLYKNGGYVGSYTINKDFESDATNTTIGRETYASGYFGFNGLITDLRVYDHVLSVREVKELARGLAVHWKLNDSGIEPTTNLVTTEDGLSNTCYNGATNKYSYGTTTDMYKTVTTHLGKTGTKVYMGTDGLAAYPYVYFDNFNSAGTRIRTLSFDYWPTIQNTLIPYSYNGTYNWSWTTDTTSGSATNTSAITITGLNLGQWNHITVTAQKYDTSNTSRGIGYIRIGSASHTSSTSNFWFFSNIQIEDKDHATLYSGGPSKTRNQLICYDSSGFGYHGSLVSGRNIYVLSDAPRYSASTKFPLTSSASGNYITLDNSSLISTLTSCTITWWGKYTSAKSLLITGQSTSYYLAAGNASFYNGNVTSTSRWYVDGSPVATPSYVAGAWHMYAWKGDIHAFTKFMLNNYGGGDNWSINGQIVDFRVYTTALSDDDILELYHTSAEIDKSGNFYSRELIE